MCVVLRLMSVACLKTLTVSSFHLHCLCIWYGGNLSYCHTFALCSGWSVDWSCVGVLVMVMRHGSSEDASTTEYHLCCASLLQGSNW